MCGALQQGGPVLRIRAMGPDSVPALAVSVNCVAYVTGLLLPAIKIRKIHIKLGSEQPRMLGEQRKCE